MVMLLWPHKYLTVQEHFSSFPSSNWITKLNRLLEWLRCYGIFCAWLSFWYPKRLQHEFLNFGPGTSLALGNLFWSSYGVCIDDNFYVHNCKSIIYIWFQPRVVKVEIPLTLKNFVDCNMIELCMALWLLHVVAIDSKISVLLVWARVFQ